MSNTPTTLKLPHNAYETFLNRKHLPYVTTGSPKLDAFLGGGFRCTGTYVLSGGPGAGKTTKTLDFAEGAMMAGWPVIYMSGELSPDLLLARMASKKLGMSWLDVVDMPKDAPQVPYYDAFAKNLGDHLWILDPEETQTYPEYVMNIRWHLNTKYGFNVPVLLIADYIQDIAQPRTSQKGVELRNAVADLSREWRLFAQEQQCPMLIVSSTGRQFYAGQEENEADASLIASAKEAGEVEYNVFSVMYLRRRTYGQFRFSEIVVAKNRFGENPVSILYETNPVTGESKESSMPIELVKTGEVTMKIYELIKQNPGKYSKAGAIAKVLKMKFGDVAASLDALISGMGPYKIKAGVEGFEGYLVVEGGIVEAIS